MRSRALSRCSRKQFHHPLPLVQTVVPLPIIPRHQFVRTPAPPALYRGSTRRGWINQQTQDQPVARKRRSNWPHGICLQSTAVVRAVGKPGKKGTSGGGGKPPPKPPGTAAPRIPGHRVANSPAPVGWLGGASRRGRLPGQVIAFRRLRGRRVGNPQARPTPESGNAWRPRGPVNPPITNLTSIPVERGHRWGRAPRPGPPVGMYRRGRVPQPTAPFLLREGRRLRGTRPTPARGKTRRGRVPGIGTSSHFPVGRHRFYRIFLPPATMLEANYRRGLVWHTGQQVQGTVFPCDVLPARPEAEETCLVRPEASAAPGGRPEGEETCSPRPPRCPNES